MKRSLHFVLCLLIVVGTSDIFARRGGGTSSFRSSSRPAAAKPTFKPKPAPAKPKPTVKPSDTKGKPAAVKPKPAGARSGKSNFNKSKAVKNEKQKALAKSGLSKKKQKALAQKNNTAAKKYGNKKNAEKAFREKMAEKNKYTSSAPPSKRPENIPQNVTINNTSINTSYGMLPGGGYGYGYMDPMSGVFCALAAHHMLATDAMLMHHGYGTYGPEGHPVMLSTGASIAMIIVWIVIGCVVVGAIIFAIAKS